MGQRYRPMEAFRRATLDADEADDVNDAAAASDYDDDGDDALLDDSVSRKRRHRVGSKPPWLKPALRHKGREMDNGL